MSRPGQKWWRPGGFPPSPLAHQPACKPGSVGRGREPSRDGHSSATPVAWRLEQPTRTTRPGHGSRALLLASNEPAPSLFGLAPGGVCRAAGVAAGAVRSYRTVSPLPRPKAKNRGGLFSVALSLSLRPPDVIRHRMSMEPGLSSRATFRHEPERPSSRLMHKAWELRRQPSRGCVPNNVEKPLRPVPAGLYCSALRAQRAGPSTWLSLKHRSRHRPEWVGNGAGRLRQRRASSHRGTPRA